MTQLHRHVYLPALILFSGSKNHVILHAAGHDLKTPTPFLGVSVTQEGRPREKDLVCRPPRLATPLWWLALLVMEQQWELPGRSSPLVLAMERWVHYGNHSAVGAVWVRQGSVASVVNVAVLCAPCTPRVHCPHREHTCGSHLEATLGPPCCVRGLHSKCKSKLHTPQDLYFPESKKQKSSCLGRPISVMYFCLILFSSKAWLRVFVPTHSRV